MASALHLLVILFSFTAVLSLPRIIAEKAKREGIVNIAQNTRLPPAKFSVLPTEFRIAADGTPQSPGLNDTSAQSSLVPQSVQSNDTTTARPFWMRRTFRRSSWDTIVRDDVDCNFHKSTCGWNSASWTNRWKLVTFDAYGRYHYLAAPIGFTTELKSHFVPKSNSTRCLMFKYEAMSSGLDNRPKSFLTAILRLRNGTETILHSSKELNLPKHPQVYLNIYANQEFQISFLGESSSYSFTTKLFYIKLLKKPCPITGTLKGEDLLRRANPPMRWQKEFWNPPNLSSKYP